MEGGGGAGVKGISGLEHQDLTDDINRLECELAFLSGRLNETRDEKEKEELQEKFFQIARELNHYKELKKS